MPSTWSDIQKEVFDALQTQGDKGIATLFNAKIGAVSQETRRPLLVYATDFLAPSPHKQVSPGEVMIDRSDKEGFQEICHGITDRAVDVLIHSPGGTAEAADMIVKLLRRRFESVRFIVPNIAMSAATMLALSGDEILLDDDAELGPIDPQFQILMSDRIVVAPAQAIIDQFDECERKIASDPRLLPAWLPIIQSYAPSLYTQARNAINLSKTLVKGWLAEYMLRNENRAKFKAAAVARHLADHNNFLSHGKGLQIEDFRRIPCLRVVKIVSLSQNPALQDAVQGLYHLISIGFSMGPWFKMFINSNGRRLIRLKKSVAVSVPAQIQPAGQQPQLIPTDPGQN